MKQAGVYTRRLDSSELTLLLSGRISEIAVDGTMPSSRRYIVM